MKPPTITTHLGDCLEVLRTLPDGSVHACVTDPPYELWSGNGKGRGFMGKEWDGTGIAYNVDLWREVLRVLKPGGHVLAFGGSRTSHRLVCAIEDAGFEIRDGVVWLYGSGFPKSLNVSKAIDKAAGAEREVVGHKRAGICRDGRTDEEGGVFGPGLVEEKKRIQVTAPATDAARKWQGWGTALKPAHEPCTLARKPIVGTVAQNVLTFGCGAINVDGCRVEGAGAEAGRTRHGGGTNQTYAQDEWTKKNMATMSGAPQPAGRWPANVILDEAAAAEMDRQSGVCCSGYLSPKHNVKETTGWSGGSQADRVRQEFQANAGGASRFFYVAKSSRSERELGLAALQSKTAGQATDRKDDTAGLNSPRAGAGRTGGADGMGVCNFHPT